MKTLLVAMLGMVAVGSLVLDAGEARADVYACKDKEGVVRFADRKLKGFRCVLYAKTPAPAPESVADSGGDGAGATGDGDGGGANGGDSGRPARSKAEQRRLAAFERPNPRVGASYASIPPPSGGTPRFSGDEPEDRLAREKLYAPYIEEAAALYDIPEAFIRAVMRVESNFRYRARSEAGAMGLMQIMPSVIKDMGVDDPWDPRANVLGGTRLLRALADRYEGDMVKVLAAYHAGVGSVAKADGIPFEATESYVRSVLDRYYAYKSEEASP